LLVANERVGPPSEDWILKLSRSFMES